jgi:hypothetical protein
MASNSYFFRKTLGPSLHPPEHILLLLVYVLMALTLLYSHL